MLSTIRTIFTFNKNLTLGLPSALTWVFLYNHEGPCGVILCSLETMIIKKHLLSDFFFLHLIIPSPLVSLPSWMRNGTFHFFLHHHWIPLFFWWTTAHSSPAFTHCYAGHAGVVCRGGKQHSPWFRVLVWRCACWLRARCWLAVTSVSHAVKWITIPIWKALCEVLIE